MSLEVFYGILKTYKLEMINRKSMKAGQGLVVELTKALIVQEPIRVIVPTQSQLRIEKIVDELDELVKIVVLEYGKKEFYTVDELDDLNKSVAYLTSKFSNIRLKRPRIFKRKDVKINTCAGKGEYRTNPVDRAKIRCFNCDEVGNFATECRKSRKVKKDTSCVELEAKYEALLKKQQRRAYISNKKDLV